MTRPINPFDSVAPASAAAASHIQQPSRGRVGFLTLRDDEGAESEARKNDRPESSVTICAMHDVPDGGREREPRVRAERDAAQRIARERDCEYGEESRRAPATGALPTRGHRRVRSAAAVTQYWIGGFSKYLRSLRRGVTQSPVTDISRAISA